MSRLVAAVSAAFLLLGPGLHAVAADAGEAGRWAEEQTRGLRRISGTYVNRNYGFEVQVPSYGRGWGSRAPDPNHGVRIILGPNRMIELSASFDAPDYGSTRGVLDSELDGVDAAAVRRTSATLGGAPAEQAVFETGGVDHVVVAQRIGPDDDAVDYVVRLTTTPQDDARDRRALADVMGTFRHIRRVP